MSNHAMRPRRILAGVLAGALAITASPILGFTGVASAQTEADPLGAGNFCEDVPQTEPFSDITAADPAFGHIVCLVATEITVGFPDGTYRPLASTTRRQMALFLTRLADEADRLEVGDSIEELPEYDGTPDFSDHAAEEADQEAAIGQLNQAGIASGFPDGEYKGGASVSRRQMATFIYNLYEFLTGAPLPAATEDHFADDNADSADQQARTNAVAEAGIFIGNADGTFAPSTPINRRQMARVMTRTLQVLFDAGEITAWEAAAPPAGDVDFPADEAAPGAIQQLTFDPNGTGLRSATYTFSGLDDTDEFDIAFFPVNDINTEYAEDSVQVAGGAITFRDQDTTNDDAYFNSEADDECLTSMTNWNSSDDAEIVSINGVAVNDQCEFDVNPENGELEVRVTNDDFEADSAFLAIWQDVGGNNDELNLTPTDAAAEPFGLVGPIVWSEGECLTGEDVEEETLFVDTAANTILGESDDCHVVYDPTDQYTYYNGSDYFDITAAEFDAWVSTGDYVADESEDDDPAYTRTGTNLWLIDDDDRPNTPAGVTATVGDLDDNAADVATNDVRVSWTHNPPGANMLEDTEGDAGYCVDRWNPATMSSVDGDCYTWDDNNADGEDAVITNKTVVVEDVPAGNWFFTVYALSASDDDSDYSDPSAPVATAVATGSPLSVATSTADDGDSNVDTGDVLGVVFNEGMSVAVAGDAVTLTDADGTVCTFTEAGNATFAYADALPTPGSETLGITITGAGVCSAAGSTGGLQYPATVSGSANIVDANQGLAWNITDSPDKVFD